LQPGTSPEKPAQPRVSFCLGTPPPALRTTFTESLKGISMAEQPVALITGSGKRRIGSFVADALADRNYRIVIHYRTSEEEALSQVEQYQMRGIEAIAVQADLCDELQVRALVDETLRQFGRIDVLVNCAAIWNKKPFEEVTAADVRAHFEVNTLATFLCAQYAGLAMVSQESGGNIVNVGDWATVRPYRNYAAYFPSKAAIPGLTRNLAVELGTRNPNIRVNCVLPGPVMLPADLGPEERNSAIRATLVKREGTPHNVVQAVLFFLDNDFVTGVSLPVDGGRSIYAPDS